MRKGEWVYCKYIDAEFQIYDIRGGFIMEDGIIGYTAESCEVVPVIECPKCHKDVPKSQVTNRYSFTVYAGKFCETCCYGFRDNCGLDRAQGNAADLDEELEPEPY